MQFDRLNLDGVVEIVPRKISDQRGYFSEVFRHDDFLEQIGPAEFVQDNQSLSVQAGTIRGIHFQSPPAAQGKLVRCIAGKLFDVAVDLRSDSPTYGRWQSVILTPESNNQLWVPIGFGHGFCSLEQNSIISYRCTEYYSPENDLGVAWDDPDIGIEWPEIAAPETLSGKDRSQPSLIDLPGYFTVESSRCA
jgi:dTDP-4-dehydrorhamnose 3,5-epimerase